MLESKERSSMVIKTSGSSKEGAILEIRKSNRINDHESPPELLQLGKDLKIDCTELAVNKNQVKLTQARKDLKNTQQQAT
eukprot:14593697-Ditylum_brightwellii.AAC.1